MSNLKLFIEPSFSRSAHKIDFKDKIFLLGSCFSENVSQLLSQRKFQIMSNPHGILFDILSLERCLLEISVKKQYDQADLFQHGELYGSWNHHTSFSNTKPNQTTNTINDAICRSFEFLSKTKHVILTLGSAFSYFHINEKRWVANCHKIPQTEFQKILLPIEDILTSLTNIYNLLLKINPEIRLTLTISPVRHLRDGVIENNQSKARLIEAVNLFIQKHADVYYFPSYEIVIDVLRDYRFYDIDYAHPNFLATNIVFDYFRDLCIDPKAYKDMDKFYHLYLAMNHRAKHRETADHINFLQSNKSRVDEYIKLYPHLDFNSELKHFSAELEKLKIRS
ncbi:MAG: GSCFA domain-containing protein [Chitinophagales bacterium]|jgi:hypothetical protein|nr:GSCFA domain-containing protein [Sphingobacteriales bacterium]